MNRLVSLRAVCALLLFGAALLVGCGSDGRQDAADPGLRVYRHSTNGVPTSLDPVQSATAYTNMIVINVYDTLYAYKYLARPFELKTNLAAAMPEISADGLTYTVRLKPGVYFIDDPVFPDGKGREVVAEDVVYSIKRHFDPAMRPQGAWLWQGKVAGLDEWKDAGSDYEQDIEGLRALDRYTLQIKLVRPYPQLPFTLAQGYSAVVPREAVEKYGRDLALRPIGSGPFRLVSFDKTRVVMEPNQNWRWQPVDIYAEGYDEETQGFSGVAAIHGQTPPFVDRFEIDFIQDSAAMWNSFTKGNEVQITGLPVELADSVLASKRPVTLREDLAEKYHITSEIETGFVYQGINMDFPEFGYHPDPAQEKRNHALRCAMIKAFDWNARNESFYFGLGVIFPGAIPPVVPEFDPELSRDSVTRDVSGARRLLAENGWTPENLPELLYGTGSGVVYRQFFEQARAWLVEIGWPREKIILKQFATFGDLNRQWRESRLPYIGLGWGLDYPDAQNTLQLFYGPYRAPGSNLTNYNNPEYNALYEQAAVMQPSPERTEIYRRMNRILIGDCVTIIGLSRTRIPIWHREVVMHPAGGMVGGFQYPFIALSDGAGGIRQAARSAGIP
ncbi:MAG: ABC transporter substrate-binding protein [Gammaproteobacteria bacterium]|nr:ABC transporter substrate-binding protein [Gammaproteobacteria bacterium]